MTAGGAIRRSCASIATALLASSTASGHPAPSPARSEVLVRTERAWTGAAYAPYPKGRPLLTTLRLTIPAHSVLPWHLHPSPNVAFVVSGAITVEDRASGRRRTFHAGQAFGETVEEVHRGATGDRPAVLLVTYAGVQGQPTSVPASGQRREY